MRRRRRSGRSAGAWRVVRAWTWLWSWLQAGVGSVVAGIRGRPRVAVAVVLAFGLAVALVRIGPPVQAWLVAHPYFAVEEIIMSPTRRVQPGGLLRWAGIGPGMSIWQTSPRRLARRITAHPWVRTATVRRELPRRLVIDLRERESLALVSLDRLYHVDRRGVVFAALGDADRLNLPLITGLGETAASRRRALREAIKVLHLVQTQGLSFRVSEVHIQQEHGVRLFPVEPALALTFGWGDPREKVRRLETVLASHAGREGQIREIDLTFHDDAVVRFKRM